LITLYQIACMVVNAGNSISQSSVSWQSGYSVDQWKTGWQAHKSHSRYWNVFRKFW